MWTHHQRSQSYKIVRVKMLSNTKIVVIMLACFEIYGNRALKSLNKKAKFQKLVNAISF